MCYEYKELPGSRSGDTGMVEGGGLEITSNFLMPFRQNKTMKDL